MNDREKLAAVAAMGTASIDEMNFHLERMVESYEESDETNLNLDDTSDFTEQELENVYMGLRSDIDTVEEDTE